MDRRVAPMGRSYKRAMPATGLAITADRRLMQTETIELIRVAFTFSV
jgi:hypothetical protein